MKRGVARATEGERGDANGAGSDCGGARAEGVWGGGRGEERGKKG